MARVWTSHYCSGSGRSTPTATCPTARFKDSPGLAFFEGFRLLREREAYNKILAAKVQKNRYQDMVFRLSRNEAMSKYQSSFNAAAWLAR